MTVIIRDMNVPMWCISCPMFDIRNEYCRHEGRKAEIFVDEDMKPIRPEWCQIEDYKGEEE